MQNRDGDAFLRRPNRGSKEFTCPRSTFDASTDATAGERSVHATSPSQAAVFKQVTGTSGIVIAGPRVHDLSAIVDEVG